MTCGSTLSHTVDVFPHRGRRLSGKQLIVEVHESRVAQQRQTPENDQHQEHAAQEGEQQNWSNRDERSLDQHETHEGHYDRGSGEHEKCDAWQGNAHEGRDQDESEHLMSRKNTGKVVQHTAETQVVQMAGDCPFDGSPCRWK